MLRTITLRALQGAIALCMFAAPASAATFFGGVLGPGAVFSNLTATPSSNGVVSPGHFEDTYKFTYTPLPLLTVTTTTTNNNLKDAEGADIFKISNFQTRWVLEGPGGGTLFDSGLGAGVVTNMALLLATPGGLGPTYTFDLIVSGDAEGSRGGLYNFALASQDSTRVAETPLPAALSLFLTGLGGLGLLGRRRRRTNFSA